MELLESIGPRPRQAPPDVCSVCSSWSGRVAATHRGHKPYSIACPFDPHRPYQSFLFSISYIVKDPSIGTNALTKVKFRVSEAL